VNKTTHIYVAVWYEGGETIYALYIDGKLFMAGDNYHTGLYRVIEGWWRCLKHFGQSDQMIKYEVPDCEELYDNGGEVPITWPNEYSKNAKECKLKYD